MAEEAQKISRTAASIFELTSALRPLTQAAQTSYTELGKLNNVLKSLGSKSASKNWSEDFKKQFTDFKTGSMEAQKTASQLEAAMRRLSLATKRSDRKAAMGEAASLQGLFSSRLIGLQNMMQSMLGSKEGKKIFASEAGMRGIDDMMRASQAAEFTGRNMKGLAASVNLFGGMGSGVLSHISPQMMRITDAGSKLVNTFKALGPQGAAAFAAIAVVLAGTVANVMALTSAIGFLKSSYTALYDKMKEGEIQMARLQTAFGDQVAASREYMKAVLYAARTPVDVSQVVDSVAVLRSFRFDPFAEADPKTGRAVLDILMDMAGAMGTDLATATHALYRAQVGEWEIMQNNFQISARMIPQLKGLTSGTKEYGKAIIQFLADQNRFLGGQKIMAATLSGMWSNIMDAFTNTMIFAAGVADSKANAIGETLYDSFRSSMRLYYDAVSTGNAFNEFGKQIGDVANKSKDYAGSLKILTDEFGNYRDMLLSVAGGKGDADMKIGSLLQRAYFSSGGATDSFFQLYDKAMGRGNQIIMIGRTIGQVFKVIWEATIAPMLAKGAKVVDWFFESFARGLDKVIGFDTLLRTSGESTFQSLEQGITALSKTLGISSEDLATGLEYLSSEQNKALREQLIGTQDFATKTFLVIALFGEFFAQYFRSKFSWIADAAEDFVVGFKAGFLSVFDGEVIGQFMHTLSELGKALRQAFGRGEDGEMSGAAYFGILIGKIIGGIGVLIVRSMQLSMVVGIFVAKAIAGFIFIINSLNKVEKYLDDLALKGLVFVNDGFQKIVNKVKELFDWLRKIYISFTTSSGIGRWIGGLVEEIGTAFRGGLDRIFSEGTLLGNIKQRMKEMWTSVMMELDAAWVNSAPGRAYTQLRMASEGVTGEAADVQLALRGGKYDETGISESEGGIRWYRIGNKYYLMGAGSSLEDARFQMQEAVKNQKGEFEYTGRSLIAEGDAKYSRFVTDEEQRKRAEELRRKEEEKNRVRDNSFLRPRQSGAPIDAVPTISTDGGMMSASTFNIKIEQYITGSAAPAAAILADGVAVNKVKEALDGFLTKA